MPRGGARNRTGKRAPDPRSARSDKLGVRFGKLPAGGYTGRLPAWPLTTPATARERQVWRWAWRTPQAAAWISEPWRHRAVAQWVRLSVQAEGPDAPAAIHAQLIRYADQIGLTPAGLRENRWEIQEVPGAVTSSEPVEPSGPSPAPAPPPVPLRERLKVVGDGGG